MKCRICSLVVFIFLIVLFSFELKASDTNLSGFNVQYFRLTTDNSGVLSIYGSRVSNHLKPVIRFDTHVGGNLINAGNPVNNQTVDLVKLLWTTDLSFAIGLFDFMNFGIQLPLNFYEKGVDTNQNTYQTTSLGDIIFETKFNVFKGNKFIPGIALLAGITAPTGSKEKFTGQGSPTGEFRLILDKKWSDLYLSANFGYKLIERHRLFNPQTSTNWNITDDDRITFGLGLKYNLPWQNKAWSVMGQIFGQRVLDSSGSIMTPVEFTIGGEREIKNNYYVQFGAGRGLTDAVGSPAYRVFLGFAYRFGKKRSKCNCRGAIDYLEDIVNFNFGSYELSENAIIQLNDKINNLNNVDYYKIEVDGYTDDIGTKQYNMELSKQRAEKVSNYLEANGIQKNKIEVNWFGESKPKVPNITPKNRVINRRVEILVR